MNNATGDFYNIATLVAAKGVLNGTNQEGKMIKELMNSKDDIDGEKILKHMDDFSCEEEMERYADQCEMKHEKPC